MGQIPRALDVLTVSSLVHSRGGTREWTDRRHYHHLLLELYRLIWAEAERRRVALRGGAPPTPLASMDTQSPSNNERGPSSVLPKLGTGVQWIRGGSEGVRAGASASGPTSSRPTGWRRVLDGMPFFRPDSTADTPSSSAENGPIEGPGGDIAHTTLPLHAAARLFLNHGWILLFDEVQLVDVASAGLLRRTLEAYWRLGGVVVGECNSSCQLRYTVLLRSTEANSSLTRDDDDDDDDAKEHPTASPKIYTPTTCNAVN